MRTIPIPESAPRYFTTHEELSTAMTDTQTVHQLYAAVTDTDLLVAPHRSVPGAVGVNFVEKTPHSAQARTSGTVLITGDGTITVRAHMIPCERWEAALGRRDEIDMHLLVPGTVTVTPSVTDPESLRPRSITTSLRATGPLRVETSYGRPNADGEVTAMFMVIPDRPGACHHAWWMGARFFEALAHAPH